MDAEPGPDQASELKRSRAARGSSGPGLSSSGLSSSGLASLHDSLGEQAVFGVTDSHAKSALMALEPGVIFRELRAAAIVGRSHVVLAKHWSLIFST